MNFKILLVLISLLHLACENKLAREISNLSIENHNLKSDIPNEKDIKLLSWNIKDLGRTKNAEEILQIAKIIREFDIVAIQEVVAKDPAGAQAVAKIADELNRMGNKWDYSISNPTKSPSSNMSERYAFIWKTNKLDIVGSPYLDDELAKAIIREPFIAKFKLKNINETFILINFHSRKHDDNPELEIRHFSKYEERLKSNRVLIAGDFNLNERHNVWSNLYQRGYKSALMKSKTTLKRKCKNGDYLSHDIDNIYYSKGISFVNSGVLDYIEKCDNLKTARMISDHLPVFLEFTINDN